MPDDPYSIGDLARLADVTPRTVRYYVTQGLLPSPDAAGPATRYGEAHLARLRLIKRLQRDHLPLAEIRLRLERLRDDEVIATVAALEARLPEPPSEAGDTLAFVRELMTRSGVRPTTGDGSVPAVQATTAASIDEAWAARPAPVAPSAPAPRMASLLRRMEVGPDVVPAPAMAPPAPDPDPAPGPGLATPDVASPRVAPDRSTWERLAISPDVELHVRRPLDRRTNKRVDQLERIARELFEDG